MNTSSYFTMFNHDASQISESRNQIGAHQVRCHACKHLYGSGIINGTGSMQGCRIDSSGWDGSWTIACPDFIRAANQVSYEGQYYREWHNE